MNKILNHREDLMMRRSYLVLLIIALCLSLGILQSEKSLAKDDEIKPEEVVAKHLNSLGEPRNLAAIRSRMIRGSASLELIQGGFGNIPNGTSLIVSEPNRLGIVMRFSAFNYPGEHFAFDGHDATVGYLDFDTKSRLGSFITQFYGLIEEGLLGGILSVSWPLLDIQESQPKLKYNKRTIGERNLHELTYNPKSRSGMLRLQIKLFFDFETFRHVMTEYSHSYSYGIYSDITVSRRSIRMLLREEFGDFREVDGLMLPHKYTINYSEDTIPFIGRYTIKAQQWLHNTQIDPGLFKAKLLRTAN